MVDKELLNAVVSKALDLSEEERKVFIDLTLPKFMMQEAQKRGAPIL